MEEGKVEAMVSAGEGTCFLESLHTGLTIFSTTLRRDWSY